MSGLGGGGFRFDTNAPSFTRKTTTPSFKFNPNAPLTGPIGKVITDLATGGKNVAGYIEERGGKNTFVYVQSKSLNLPAAAYVMDTLGTDKDLYNIFTNLPWDHWFLTYTTNNEDVVRVTDATLEPWVDDTRPLNGATLSVLGGDRAILEPIPGGGLYDTAERLAAGGKGNTGRDKGLERALRYYLLAGHSLLGLCAEGGYSQGNYIAALMVGDTGKILSFGVNSSYWHHGEVNMLFNYFSREGNSTKPKFEEKTIVFSTLTPCKQCTDYLLACRPTKSHIYIGQEDTGSFGEEGANYFEFLDDVTKPLQIQPIDGGLKRVALHSHLSNQIRNKRGTVAKNIGRYCQEILKQSKEFFVKKTHKDRDDLKREDKKGVEKDRNKEEQDLKRDVLSYLAAWLDTVNLTVREVGTP
jgi:tRNA(Arg) A34 adenosine deaminase TadA